MGRGKVGREVEGLTRRCMNNNLPADIHGDKDDLYPELWHSCAGPLVYVPRTAEKVVYFPQGHMEQVEACTNEDGIMEMPIYNLPSKILCEVVYVQLKAEAGTDEVFAQITLLPLAKQDYWFRSEEDGHSPNFHQKTYVQSFSKKLTSSDTSTHGGFSVLKRHAEECLPPMDLSQETPEQKILAKDLHGLEWCFRHVFRGQPKRHLLTAGWSTFVSSKKLVAGDAFIFLRGQNGEFRLGVRRAMKLQNNASTTIISAHSMQHGILATACHAVNTGTMFTVYYRPWTSPSEFIVPFDQYMKSAEIDYSVGTRFRMLFESEESADQRIERFEGTIVGNKDVDHIHWPKSEWRSLKVKWDATSNGSMRPERVSPWNIEPIEPMKRKQTSLPHPLKKACSTFPSIVKDGLLLGPVEYTTQNHSEVLQGQEKRDTGIKELGALIPPPIQHLIPPNPDSNNTSLGLGNQLSFSAHGPFHLCPNSTVLSPGGNIARMGFPNCCCPSFDSYGIPGNALRSRKLSVLNGSQDWKTLELKDANEVLHAPPDGGDKCVIFGVNLVKNPPELPSPQVESLYSDRESLYSAPPMSQCSVSEPSRSTSSTNSVDQSKNCHPVANQYCTKGIFRCSNMELQGDQLTCLGLMDMNSNENLSRCSSSREA